MQLTTVMYLSIPVNLRQIYRPLGYFVSNATKVSKYILGDTMLNL